MSEETGRNLFQNTEAQIEFEVDVAVEVPEEVLERIRAEKDDPVPELNLGTLWERANPKLSGPDELIRRHKK